MFRSQRPPFISLPIRQTSNTRKRKNIRDSRLTLLIGEFHQFLPCKTFIYGEGVGHQGSPGQQHRYSQFIYCPKPSSEPTQALWVKQWSFQIKDFLLDYSGSCPALEHPSCIPPPRMAGLKPRPKKTNSHHNTMQQASVYSYLFHVVTLLEGAFRGGHLVPISTTNKSFEFPQSIFSSDVEISAFLLFWRRDTTSWYLLEMTLNV